MKYRALAIDLDGTLLDGEDLPPVHRDAVAAAAATGFEVIIATARWRQMAERISREIGIKKPIIACSGAQVFAPGTGDIFDHRLPAGFIDALYSICNQHRCLATITTDEDVILKLDREPDSSKLPLEIKWVPQLDKAVHGRARIAAIQGTEVIDMIRSQLGPAFSETVSIYDSIGPSGKLVITITARQANKGSALLAACEHLSLDPASVIAFGDAENDIEMFKVAGASVAMGQANDKVKAAASCVTGANTEGGVATVIERLLKQGEI